MDQALFEQNNILREIRDELRQTRANPVDMAGAVDTVRRPSSTFVNAQHTADRMISGEWGSLGWSNAYKSEFKSSLTQDIFGSMGLSRAPNIMSQIEYQQASSDSLNNRLTRYSGFMAPSYVGRIQSLSEEIFANSQRFAWAGDSNVGVGGAGVNFGTAHRMARQVQSMSVGDLRLSGNDYNTIVATGLRTGQFDHTSGNDDFVKKVKEMATAVGDLTRTLHLGVQEVSQAMGTMRQYGIVDVADQRRSLMHIQAAAQAGGLTTGEAMKAWGDSAQMGMGAGVSAQVAGQLGVDNLVQVRNLSRRGVVPNYVMALGGGAEGISNSINQAQLNFLSSTTGYYGLAGGGAQAGANIFNSLTKGISETGGTLQGVFAAQADKMTAMDLLKKDPSKIDQLYTNQISSRLKLLNVDPMDTSNNHARDAAYMIARQQMGDAAGLTWANQHYTAEGRRSQEMTEINSRDAERYAQGRLDYDDYYRKNSVGGRIQSAMAAVRRIPARLADWSMDTASSLVGSNGQTSWFGTSPMSSNLQAQAFGAPDNVSDASLVNSVISGGGFRRGPAKTTSIDFEASNRYGAAGGLVGMGAGGLGGALLGGLSGAGTGAYFGSFLGPVGTAVGGLAGGLYGAYSGAMGGAGLGEIFGSWLGGKADSDPKHVEGATAQSYLESLDAVKSSSSVSADRLSVVKKELFKNKDYQDIVAKGNVGQLTGTAAIDFATKLRRIGITTGGLNEKGEGNISQAEVMAAAKDQGVSFELESASRSTDINSAEKLKQFESVIGDGLLKGVKATGINFATTENVQTLRDVVKFRNATGGKDLQGLGSARKKLLDQGMDADQVEKLITNAKGGGGYNVGGSLSRADEYDKVLAERAEGGSNEAVRRITKDTTDYFGKILRGSDKIDDKKLLESQIANGSAIDMIHDKKLRGVLTQSSQIAKDMARVDDMSMEQLMKASAKDVGVTREQLDTVKDKIGAYSGPDKEKKMKEAIEVLLMKGGSAAKGEDKKSNEDALAASIQTSSQILQKIASDLHISIGTQK